MPNILFHNMPLNTRTCNKIVRRLRRESTIQHSLEPYPATTTQRAVGPQRWQNRGGNDLLRVRKGGLCERFLLRRVGVVE